MRCIAVAQAWIDLGGNVVWFAATMPEGLQERISSEGIALRIGPDDLIPGSEADALATAAYARESGCAALVIDGYHFRDPFLVTARSELPRLTFCLIDDWGQSTTFPVDLVVNQNTPPWPTSYAELVGPRVLTGTEWTLLRREFREHVPATTDGTRCLVTFGGSDPAVMTPGVVEALSGSVPLSVVLGSAARHVQRVRDLAARGADVEVLSNVTDMPGLMSRCAFAVTASGSTVWELCYFAIPMILVPVARNQLPIADYMASNAAALRVDPGPDFAARLSKAFHRLRESETLRNDLAAAAGRLIDGHGALRTCRAILNVVGVEHAADGDNDARDVNNTYTDRKHQ